MHNETPPREAMHIFIPARRRRRAAFQHGMSGRAQPSPAPKRRQAIRTPNQHPQNRQLFPRLIYLPPRFPEHGDAEGVEVEVSGAVGSVGDDLDAEWVAGVHVFRQGGGIPGEADGVHAVGRAGRGVAGELGEHGVAGDEADGVAEEGGFYLGIIGPHTDGGTDGVAAFCGDGADFAADGFVDAGHTRAAHGSGQSLRRGFILQVVVIIPTAISARVEEGDGGVGLPSGEPASASGAVFEFDRRVDRQRPAVDG